MPTHFHDGPSFVNFAQLQIECIHFAAVVLVRLSLHFG